MFARSLKICDWELSGKQRKSDIETQWGSVLLLVGLGAEADTWPVVCVWQEGVIAGVPHSGPYKAVLVQRLRVAERHAVSIDILHHLQQERQSGELTNSQTHVLRRMEGKPNTTRQLRPTLSVQHCCVINRLHLGRFGSMWTGLSIIKPFSQSWK